MTFQQVFGQIPVGRNRAAHWATQGRLPISKNFQEKDNPGIPNLS